MQCYATHLTTNENCRQHLLVCTDDRRFCKCVLTCHFFLLSCFASLCSTHSIQFFFRQSLCLSTRNVWRPVIVVVVIVVGGDDDYDGMCDEIYRTFGGVCMRAWDFSSMVSFVRIVISAEVCNAYMPKANENKTKNGNNLISFLFVFIVEEEREGETTRVSQQATYIHGVNTPRSSNCGCF